MTNELQKIDLVDINNIGLSDLSRKKLHLKDKDISIVDNNHICICIFIL